MLMIVVSSHVSSAIFSAGLGGHVPGTSEVSEKLLFPVEGLVTYLQNTHGLHQDGA